MHIGSKLKVIAFLYAFNCNNINSKTEPETQVLRLQVWAKRHRFGNPIMQLSAVINNQ